MKKILLVSNTAYNILHFRRSIWLRLLAEGYDVIALAPADGKEQALIEAGLTFIELEELERFQNSPIGDFRLLQRLRQVYRKVRADVILHFTIKPNIYGTLAAYQAGIPSLVTITGLGTTWLNGRWLKYLSQELYRRSLPYADAVIGQNAHDIEALQKVGVQAKSWQLIPGSGIDTVTFYPTDRKRPKSEVVFLYLGRMLIDKGIAELLTAWRQIHHLMPNARLQLVGEYDEVHPRCIDAKIWSQRNKLPRVECHSFQEDVRPFIGESSVVVLPSYREGIPRSLLEAMAMAKPVIATDVPGCRELALPGETGWRVPPRSAAALAEALLLAYRMNPNTRANLGLQGRDLVTDGYSEMIVADQYLAIIRSILYERASEQVNALP